MDDTTPPRHRRQSHIGAGPGVAATPDPFGPVPFGQEEVIRGRSKRALREAGLVLQAADIPHAVQSSGAGVRILVQVHQADLALAELQEYRQENVNWPLPKAAPRRFATNGIVGAALYALVIAVMHWMQHRNGYGVQWTEVGRMEGGAVASGDWWRTITALTLHVDLNHLVSNVVFGALFGALAAQSVGPGFAWLGTVLAGLGGNALESFLVDPTHRAIGASTAIFGTLGLMTATEWARRERAPWFRRLTPLFAGAVLFGWLGVGDGSGRVDVLAHATGFLSGALIGALLGRTHLPERSGQSAQWIAAVVSLALIASGWVMALSNS